MARGESGTGNSSGESEPPVRVPPATPAWLDTPGTTAEAYWRGKYHDERDDHAATREQLRVLRAQIYR